MLKMIKQWGSLLAMCVLAGCLPTPPTYTVGGTVSGLAAGQSLVLIQQASSKTSTTVTGTGSAASFTLQDAYASGNNYTVEVATQPANQYCRVSKATGTVTSNVTSVEVSCTAKGRTAYILNATKVDAYTVDETTGGLTSLGLSVNVGAGTTPKLLKMDPLEKNLYVLDSATDKIYQYTIEAATGNLTAAGSVATVAGSTGLTFHPTGRFAYVPYSGSATNLGVSLFSVNQTTGALTQQASAAVTTDTVAVGVTVDPAGKFAYVTGRGAATNSVWVYAINQNTGALTAASTTTMNGVQQAGTLSQSGKLEFSATGRFAYFPNYGNSTVSVFSVNPSTGALTAVGTPLALGFQPYRLKADLSNQYLYIEGPSGVARASINASTGALSGLSTQITDSGGVLYFDPTMKYVYRSVTAGLATYRVDGTGALAEVVDVDLLSTGAQSMVIRRQTAPVLYVVSELNSILTYTQDSASGSLSQLGAALAVPSGSTPTRIALDPLGRFAFVIYKNTNKIAAFTINASTGVLTSVGAAIATGAWPSSVTVDPTGRFVYTTNFDGNSVSSYLINAATGALTAQGTAISTGTKPTAVVLDPDGKYAYVTGEGSNLISRYIVDATTGLLTAAGTQSISINRYNDMKFDSTGKFAFMTSSVDFLLTSFAVDASTGALTEIGTVTGFDSPDNLVIHPTGKFLFVSNHQGKFLSAFSIDQSTAALTPVNTATTGAGPGPMAIDPQGKFLYVSNTAEATLSRFSIDPVTGALTASSTISLPNGVAGPNGLAFKR